MKVTDYIAKFLHAQGVSCVFEMSGGMITHLLDSLHQDGKIQVVSMHHEQGAAFAAEGWARMTGVPGVALATSGPGATNLLTGIGSCHFDSTPAVFITGQVNRSEQKKEMAVRQLGFQETDIVSMAKPITKAAWQVQDPDAIPQILRDAFALALEGRPGPVLVDIPMDVQRADIAPDAFDKVSPTPAAPPVHYGALIEALTSAERPLILAGGGIRSSGAIDAFRALTAKLQIPVVNSLMAVDALPASDPLRVGMLGSYGNRWANLAVGRSDLLLVLGSRLDIRQTGNDTQSFKGERQIHHVDCEAAEVNNRVTGCHEYLADLNGFLLGLLQALGERGMAAPAEWLREIQDLKAQWPDTAELPNVAGINPNVFLHQLSTSTKNGSAYVIDVGQHQMWSAQSIDPGPDQRFLTSGGMGSMGFALPTAVGAAFADRARPVVVIAGDGGFQSNIQELQTVVRNQLPLKMVILNNNCHGMVRQFQSSYFDGRFQSTLWGYSAPDFTAVAQAYGIASRTVSSVEDVPEALAWLSSNPAEPALLQVMIDTYADALPKIAFGRPMTEMEPFAQPIEMEGT